MVRQVRTKKFSKFSEKLERLEEILNTMESASMPLEDLMTLYAEGQKLTFECREFLTEAEGTIRLLDSDGSLKTFDFQKSAQTASQDMQSVQNAQED